MRRTQVNAIPYCRLSNKKGQIGKSLNAYGGEKTETSVEKLLSD